MFFQAPFTICCTRYVSDAGKLAPQTERGGGGMAVHSVSGHAAQLRDLELRKTGGKAGHGTTSEGNLALTDKMGEH